MQAHSLKQKKIELGAKVNLIQTELIRMSEVYISQFMVITKDIMIVLLGYKKNEVPSRKQLKQSLQNGRRKTILLRISLKNVRNQESSLKI